MGARMTVWFSVICYSAAAIIISSYDTVGLIIGLTGLLYVASIIGFTRITDETSALARAGWKRFLWLNYVTGAVVTMCLILLY